MNNSIQEVMAHYSTKITETLTNQPDQAMEILFQEYRLAGGSRAELVAALIGELCARNLCR